MKRLTVLMLPLALAFLIGCGGGSSNSATGRVAFKVIWPEKTRLIPQATQSIRVRLEGPNNYDQQAILQRSEGQTEATRDWRDLDPGQYTLHAEAYPNADASGVILASGSAGVMVEAGVNKQVIVVMNSTIVRIEVTPNPATVYVGEQVQLTATAYDAQDNVVLLTPGKLQWGLAGQPDEVSVNGTGLVYGHRKGEQGVTAQDTESGQWGLAVVSVLERPSGSVYMTVDYEPSRLLWCTDPFEETPSSVTESYGAIAVATDSLGRIYILSGWGGYSIVRMDDPQGTGRVTYGGTYGSGTGHFNNPSDIWVDSNGRILIADTGNSRIVRIDDMTGSGWTEYAGAQSPVGVCTDAQGRILIADPGANELVRVDDMVGTNRLETGFSHLMAVRCGAHGRVFLLTEGDGDSHLVRLDGVPPSDTDTISVPQAARLAVDSLERVWVTLRDGRVLRIVGSAMDQIETVEGWSGGGLSGIAVHEPADPI